MPFSCARYSGTLATLHKVLMSNESKWKKNETKTISKLNKIQRIWLLLLLFFHFSLLVAFCSLAFGLSYYVYLKYYVWQGCKSDMDDAKNERIRTGKREKFSFFLQFMFWLIFFSFFFTFSPFLSLFLNFAKKMDPSPPSKL